MDAGGFERLDEAGGQADREAIGDPRPVLAADTRLDQARREIGIGEPDMRLQLRLGRGIVDEAAAIDIAGAAPGREIDIPGPAGGLGGDGGVAARRRLRLIVRRLAGDRAIAQQPIRMIEEARAQRLFDQECAEARAIDEEIARDRAAVAGAQGGDIAVLAAIDPDDMIDDARHAAFERDIAQQPPELHRVEMIGIRDRRLVRAVIEGLRAEIGVAQGRLDADRAIERRHIEARVAQRQPVAHRIEAVAHRRRIEGMIEMA